MLFVSFSAFAQNEANLNKSSIVGRTLSDGTGYLDLEPEKGKRPSLQIMRIDRFGATGSPDGQKDTFFQLISDEDINGRTQWGMLEAYGGAGLYIGTGKYASPLVFAVNRQEKMRLASNGYLGIGVKNPATALHINGSIRGSGAGGALRVDSGNGTIDIGAQNTSWAHIYTDRPKVIFNKPIYSSGNAFSSYTSDLALQTNGNTRLTINSNNGNVGIGTTTPDAKLAVNGKIHAKEVKVDLQGWPDYVFKPEYDLKSLEAVEAHIAEKGHLPNIPSEQEMVENGLELGEMNQLLMEKIEELTLYTIEQEKRIKALEKENDILNELNKRIEQLEKK